MIEVSSFLTNKNLCNIFADKIVKKINNESPDAKTQITVLNVRSFFIVRGYTSSETVVNLSDILTEIYEKYDTELVKTVRVIDTILYNRKPNEKLRLSYKENKKDSRLLKQLQETCDSTQKKGFYITIKVQGNNLFYDFDYPVGFDPSYISSKFDGYNCIKDDFSNDVYISDDLYGMSNDSLKYYHVLVRKIAYNLLNKGFTSDVCLDLCSDLEIEKINSENIKLSLKTSEVISKEKLESMILDNFNFDLESLTNEFDLKDFEYKIENNIWENYTGTGDLMFL
jgi:hypothetical protein